MESASAVVEQEYPDKENASAYLIDLVALIRARNTTPPTFEEVAIHIIDTIPSGYKRVDIIADTYRPFPIKSPWKIETWIYYEGFDQISLISLAN